MAFILLGILCCSEAALAAGSLVKRSRLQRTTNVVRILQLVVFCVFLLTPAVEWSFRWYGAAALLIVRAAIGAIGLLKGSVPDREFRAGSVILRAVSALLLACVAVAPALVFPRYEVPEPTGSYEVDTAEYTFVDAGRIEEYSTQAGFRKLNVGFWYPAEGGGRYPLVVFSHGGLGTETSNESLFIELASHGYVVCSIGHAYHSFRTKFDDGTIARLSTEYLREIQREDAQTNRQQSFEYYQKWMNLRTGDINFVIDTVLSDVASRRDGVFGLVDATRIGVTGHSLGGAAALAVPRQRDDVDAVVALESPFLYDIVGVENGEFIWAEQPCPAPALNVYSDSSWDHLAEWPQYARNYEFLADPPEHVVSLHLPGRGHFSLTDLSLASPVLIRILERGEITRGNTEYLREVNGACLDFLDRYVRDAK